jgi:hypothetical protein
MVARIAREQSKLQPEEFQLLVAAAEKRRQDIDAVE